MAKRKQYTPGFEDAERVFDELTKQAKALKWKKLLEERRKDLRRGGIPRDNNNKEKEKSE